MEFGMSRRIKPKDKFVCISMKEIWRNLDGPPKNKELWSYVVCFEFRDDHASTRYFGKSRILESKELCSLTKHLTHFNCIDEL